jgi:hypothetical protein
MNLPTDNQRRLMWHGMFLLRLGLLIGFAEGQVILAWHWPLIWKV